MTTERYRDNIEALKKRGGDQKAEIIRDIFRGYPDEEEGPIPLADVQSYAYEKMQKGIYAQTTLANTRRSLYDSDSGSYGFFTWSKRGVKNYLEMTELGREFNAWLFTPENSSWGKPGAKSAAKRSQASASVATAPTEDEITAPLVLDREDADEFGLIWAKVPAGVRVAWLEETEEGKKTRWISRQSEQAPVLTKEERMAAKLREMGLDPDDI